ncbi:unnamed protein product [Paramecium primaurelia]|uniref:Sperm-tail PG-rich repeat protein n=2 Tax=Paramecium TaxID=5884 RepID=A0A8S1V5K4_9CILI|nr:unnamed protein product [Paramecium primaurelia]CAD8171897.1 unnamed protein product [Paramecium pentaurelia]
MAFLFEEDRGLTQVKDPYPHLGPGVYQQPETQPRIAYAPFLSTGKRQTELTNKLKILNPGPGQYEVSQNMGDSGVQAYMNKSTIIVKVQGNGSSAFKSGIERFQEDKKVKEIPGPGYYETQQINTQQKQPLFLNQKIDDIRSQNLRRRINSIPEPKTQIGMIYDDIETLAQHQKVMKEQKQQKVVGPTTYEIQQQQQYRGLSWDKSTRPRFDQEQTNEIGPGKYNIVEEKKRRNGSPAFLSESVRSYYDQLIYKTNREINAGLRKQINFKDQYSPGPGQYNENRVAIKIQQKAKEFQFFGSSLERFKLVQDSNVGPGDYRVLDSSFDQQIRKKNYTNATFLSTSIKGQPILLEDQQPGPGAYEIQRDLYTDLVKKQDRGLNGYFGGKERRFQEKTSICQAGPGSYDITRDEKKRAVSSCFKSSSKRDQVNKSFGPEIGQYRLDQDSIGNRIQKQMKFIQNLQKIDVLKPGFYCGEPRFKENADIQAVPTSYNYQAPPVSQKQITAPFKSQQPRLAYIGRQFTPGVGKYQVEANNWKINSFNTHYNKVLQES